MLYWISVTGVMERALTRLINRVDRALCPQTPIILLNTLMDRLDGTDSLQR